MSYWNTNHFAVDSASSTLKLMCDEWGDDVRTSAPPDFDAHHGHGRITIVAAPAALYATANILLDLPRHEDDAML